MTKQQEIREVIDTYADVACLYLNTDCKFRGKGYCSDDEGAYKCLMKRLDELGLVLKVDSAKPTILFGEEITIDSKQLAMIVEKARSIYDDAGYEATESLI